MHSRYFIKNIVTKTRLGWVLIHEWSLMKHIAIRFDAGTDPFIVIHTTFSYIH